MDMQFSRSGLDDEDLRVLDRDAFQFTTTGGAVTGAQLVAGSHTFNLHIPANATFTVAPGVVTETLTGAHETTVIRFAAEPGNPALFQAASVTETVANPTVADHDGDGTRGFSFTISGGTVTAAQVVESDEGRTSTHALNLRPDAVFTAGAGTVTETFVEGNALETRTFVQPAGQTLFTLASQTTTFIHQGAAGTALNVEPGERAMFTIAADGSVTAIKVVHSDGSTSALTPRGDETFHQLAPGFVEQVVTDHGHTSFEVFYAGPNSGGIYTAVAEGQGSSVDLAGLQAQIAQLPTSVGWII
jgi:hypothetical protein